MQIFIAVIYFYMYCLFQRINQFIPSFSFNVSFKDAMQDIALVNPIMHNQYHTNTNNSRRHVGK